MPATLYILEAANLFCSADPTGSKHLAIEQLKLPDLQEMYAEHHPGGSPVAIEIAVGIQKLEPTFKLKGFDPALLQQFGLNSPAKNVFTAYGVIRDKRTGSAIETVAVFEARLGRVAMDAFSRGQAASTDYTLSEVTHYALTFGGAEQFYWDFFTNVLRIGGTDQNATLNSILRVPSATA